MDHLNFLSWCSPEKKRNTLFVRTYKYFPLFYSPATEVFLDCERARLVCLRFLPQGTISAATVCACAESILWVVTTAKRPMKSAYSYLIKYYRPMYREIYRPMSRPIYRPLYRWSIGEASVKYRWTPTISSDRGVGRYIGGHPTDISNDTRLTIDRVSVDTRPILGRVSVDHEMSTDIAIDTSLGAPIRYMSPFFFPTTKNRTRGNTFWRCV